MGEDTCAELSNTIGKMSPEQKPGRVEIKRVSNGFIVETYGGRREEFIATTLDGALQIAKELMA